MCDINKKDTEKIIIDNISNFNNILGIYVKNKENISFSNFYTSTKNTLDTTSDKVILYDNKE